MKALVKYAPGKGNMELREMPEPSPGPGEVKIKITATGICGSDIHVLNGEIGIKMQYPVITGHEFSGIVMEIGEGVKGIEVGERVVAETTFSSCGSCSYCQQGLYYLCQDRHVLGYWVNGAFAPYTVVPESKIHKLPDSVSTEEAALVEPLAYCVHSVLEQTAVEVNECVLVTGPGPIGLISALVAKAAGARVILMGTEADEKRLAVSKEIGIDYTINIGREDPNTAAPELVGTEGVDIFLECSGSEEAVNTGLDLLRAGGKYTQSGLFGRKVTIDIEKIIFKEIKTNGAYAHKWTSWEKAIDLLATKKVQLSPVISDVLPLSEWKMAFNKVISKEGFKIILKSDL